MSIPDFERAEYRQPQTIEGESSGQGSSRVRGGATAFPLALLFGAAAALVGGVGYALIGFSGFMVSIVAIGVGWLVARAMMTASGGVGGQVYQIAAVLLTYFAVTLGELLDLLHYSGIPMTAVLHVPAPLLLRQLVAGPFLALRNPLNGGLGLLILFFGLRTAWRLAAGSSGFGQSGKMRRVNPFGLH